MAPSRILVIGATGYIGKYVANASIRLGHPTFVLVRPDSLSSKPDIIESFKTAGITILEGSVEDHNSLVTAIKQVDVVISTITTEKIPEQVKIITAIKEVGTIKRFLPSEFGLDADKAVGAVEPAHSIFNLKVQFRRVLEEANIPYTRIICNCFAGYFVSNLCQPGLFAPPKDKVLIHGNAKAIFVEEDDVGTYTIKAVDDPRTLNKTVYVRPPENTLSQSEIVALWEKKTGKTLEKVYISEEELLKKVEETPIPGNVLFAIFHDLFVKGDQTNYEIGENGVDACELYPEVKYTTVDQYLDRFL